MAKKIITDVGTTGIAAKEVAKAIMPVCPKCKGVLFLLGKRGDLTDLRCNKCNKDYTTVI